MSEPNHQSSTLTERFVHEISADESILEAVVTAVSSATGRPPVPLPERQSDVVEALPPLYDAVDPDALELLLSGAGRPEATASFTYAGFDVRVEGRRRVTLRKH
jgi:hypothetical protein